MNKILTISGLSIFCLELVSIAIWFLTQADLTTLKILGIVGINLVALIFTLVGSLAET